MKRICIVTTLWSSIDNWIKPFLQEYHDSGVDVTIVCNMDENYERELIRQFPFVHTQSINFPRGINLIGSIKSILQLRAFFRKEQFDLVQYSTPNASFYAALAAKSANIPVRLYGQWGMVFITQKGWKQRVFKTMEHLICHYSTHIQPDSHGNLNFCREIGLYDETKSCVIWNGSAKGLNLKSYDLSKKPEYAKEIKQRYNLKEAPVIGFVGRLGQEKGCNELILAFQLLTQHIPDLKLLFVGPLEKEDTIQPELLDYFYRCENIIKTGRVKDVEKHMAAMDIFILPSYREGFGMSVIEASAMAVPVIVTEYPGPSSAVEDGVTGYTVKVGSVEDIVTRVSELLSNPTTALQMGLNGRKFAEEKFDFNIFKQKYMDNRLHLLGLNN